MRLIGDIEIFYFRSLYKQRIDSLQGLNVLFGRNDAGKSNVLRALNLFFNSETNPSQAFSFVRDLCHARREEAANYRDARKFVSIKLTFHTPAAWRNSLGDTFYVKRTWSATTGAMFNQASSIAPPKQQYLTRLLNKIRFHYVPAIKDRTIFERLLGEVYEVLTIDDRFSKSLDPFTDEVRAKTSELSASLRGVLGLASSIAPPTDLRDLFRSLDFDTREEGGSDSCSLTLQRGDGIQVRHIPTILKYISDNSREAYHVWGFEEPENSLELANAISEAEYFLKVSRASNIQVFVTSHSPAFFNLRSSPVARFYVRREMVHSLPLPTSTVVRIDAGHSPSELMGETPHLAIISDYLLEAQRRMDTLKEAREELEFELGKAKRSIVFVEGVTDKKILEKAWSVFRSEDPPFTVEDSSGTTKMKSLAQDGRTLKVLAPERRLYCLVDNDGEGRDLYKNGKLSPGGAWVQHPSNGAYWCRLRPTEEFLTVMKKLGIPEANYPFTLEGCFSAELRNRAMQEGVYGLSLVPYSDLLPVYAKIATVMQGSDFDLRCYVLAPDSATKESFADWVCRTAESEAAILEPLRSIVDGLAQLEGLV